MTDWYEMNKWYAVDANYFSNVQFECSNAINFNLSDVNRYTSEDSCKLNEKSMFDLHYFFLDIGSSSRIMLYFH